MNERTLRVLEFSKIQDMLRALVTSELGAEKVAQLKPMTDSAMIIKALRETEEARAIDRTESFSLKGLTDIRSAVARARLGAFLDAESLLAVAAAAACARQTAGFFRDKEAVYPTLSYYGRQLVACRALEEDIAHAISDYGEVKDSASPKLRSLRNDTRVLQGRLRQRLEAMVRSPATQKYLQEPLITLRNDRYVLPVKIEYRGQVPGIIHDQSASGSTLFIEPMAAVEISNDLRRKMAEEQQEVERILAELSALVSEYGEELLLNIDLLAILDFSMAKGRLSYRQRATAPIIADSGPIALRQARHPLLPTDGVVSNDIYMGGAYSVLLITGPNTGGKTVLLKTVGLLVLMAQAGLHIPADEGSQLPVFETVFADIGDEQSIEQSLSTFSSHMTNIIDILRQADESSLVLLDELGAGTDPTEGAALAMAIIDYLYGLGCHLLATTHYSELKAYAQKTVGVQNASVEFDVATLRPTYRLIIGLPGKSNAFEIAQRLGLSKTLTERARKYLTGEQLRMEDLLQEIESSRLQIQADQLAAHALRQEWRNKNIELEQRLAEAQQQREQILEKARREAKQELQSQREAINKVLADLKEAVEKQALDRAEADRLADAARQTTRDLQDSLNEKQKVPKTPHRILAHEQIFAAGDEVFVKHLNQKGRLLEAPTTSGDVQVQLGALRVLCRVEQLEKLAGGGDAKEKVSSFRMVTRSKAAVPLSLDLRGRNVEESLLLLDKYLDDAGMAGLPSVSIIHGKGTGVLRKAVQDYLQGHHYVLEQRLGGPGEGGSGVTVATLTK